MYKLKDKVAIVTGGSKGIGAGIARHLASEGAAVVVNYASSRTGADAVVAEIIDAGGKAFALQADLSQPGGVERLFAEASRALGSIDILVNNAGIYDMAPMEEINPEHFHRLFDLNVLGLIQCVQEAVKHFGSRGGSIVNTSSVVSTFAPAGSSVYNATKAAVDSLTRTFAKELGPRKIRINCVNPGPVETEGAHHQGLVDKFHALGALSPLGRIGQPEDIAPAVAFLASDDASWITGTTLLVSGGLY